MSVEVQGAEQFAVLARRLREMADRDLSREMNRGIRRAVEPLRQALPESARETLPTHGGLAEDVARSRITTQRSVSGRGEGIRVRVRNAYTLGRLDRGEVRHRVYGRDVWVTQRVTPGWWTKPTEALAPEMRTELQRVLDEVAAKLDRPL